MKKRVITLLFALLFCLVWVAPSFSALDGSYIFDRAGVFSEEEVQELDALAENIYSETGVGVYFCILESSAGYDAEDVHKELIGEEDCILLLLTENEWDVLCGGELNFSLTDADEEALWNAYYENSTYYGGVEDYLTLAGQMIGGYSAGITEKMAKEAALSEESRDTGAISDQRLLPRLVDNADLLTEREEQNLLAKLDEISERQEFDLVAVTVNSLGERSATEYADDFFDYNGYGYGENYDGAIFLISMEDRDFHISTSGRGINAIGDSGIDEICDLVYSDLQDGNYSDAFETFADCCDRYVSGNAEDGSEESSKTVSVFKIVLCLILGMLLAFIPVSIMKSKLKTVYRQAAASNYIRAGSMNLTDCRDIFLYNKVSRVARSQESSGRSGGSASSHTSSSGRTHGGGGGKF